MSFLKINVTRLQLQADNEANGHKQLRDIVVAARKDLLLKARSKIIDGGVREQLKEFSQLLTVWLQSAELFSDWLDLRRRSPEFRKKFPKD